MQRLITLRRERGLHEGDIYGYRCQDCRGFWKRFQNPKHGPGCPRALRESLEYKTTRQYFKRSPTPDEHRLLSRAWRVALQLLREYKLGEVTIGLTNRNNPNGWSIRVKATKDGGFGKQTSRFIMTEWARQRGYMDVRKWH